MEVMTIADTKRRLMETVSRVMNEVALVTPDDVAKAREMINIEAATILASDIHTYHSVEVKVTILNREVAHGPLEVHMAVMLGQRYVEIKKRLFDEVQG